MLNEYEDGENWWLAARLPFDVLTELTGELISPSSGTIWRGNFHRTGVDTVSQEASWNPIRTTEKAFHKPEYFG